MMFPNNFMGISRRRNVMLKKDPKPAPEGDEEYRRKRRVEQMKKGKIKLPKGNKK